MTHIPVCLRRRIAVPRGTALPWGASHRCLHKSRELENYAAVVHRQQEASPVPGYVYAGERGPPRPPRPPRLGLRAVPLEPQSRPTAVEDAPIGSSSEVGIESSPTLSVAESHASGIRIVRGVLQRLEAGPLAASRTPKPSSPAMAVKSRRAPWEVEARRVATELLDAQISPHTVPSREFNGLRRALKRALRLSLLFGHAQSAADLYRSYTFLLRRSRDAALWNLCLDVHFLPFERTQLPLASLKELLHLLADAYGRSIPPDVLAHIMRHLDQLNARFLREKDASVLADMGILFQSKHTGAVVADVYLARRRVFGETRIKSLVREGRLRNHQQPLACHLLKVQAEAAIAAEPCATYAIEDALHVAQENTIDYLCDTTSTASLLRVETALSGASDAVVASAGCSGDQDLHRQFANTTLIILEALSDRVAFKHAARNTVKFHEGKLGCALDAISAESYLSLLRLVLAVAQHQPESINAAIWKRLLLASTTHRILARLETYPAYLFALTQTYTRSAAPSNIFKHRIHVLYHLISAFIRVEAYSELAEFLKSVGPLLHHSLSPEHAAHRILHELYPDQAREKWRISVAKQLQIDTQNHIV